MSFSHPKLEECLGPKIQNHYIIKFEDKASQEEQDTVKVEGSTNVDLWEFPEPPPTDRDVALTNAAKKLLDPDNSNATGTNAIVGTLNSEKHLMTVLNSPHVHWVCEHGYVTTQETKQSDAPWGISRLSFKDKPSGSNAMKSKFPFEYNKPKSDAKTVNVYVVDTGIDGNHNELKGRVTYLSISTDGKGKIKVKKDQHTDCHGHGTHVAGTIGGERYGVAKKCNLISVNVIQSDGCCSQYATFQALVEVLREILTQKFGTVAELPKTWKGVELWSVVNLSLGSGRTKLIDGIVKWLIYFGVHVVTAACNHNNDAMYYSPAGVESVITVGASTFTDSRAWFSNKGGLVDVYAPGVFINSATHWTGEDKKNVTETELKSGTSMACAHVSGLVAYLLSIEGERTPADMKRRVIELSLKGELSDIPLGSNNRLANFWTTKSSG